MTATVIHRLADRGLIDYEAPVAEYWPEFGANGKSALAVREGREAWAGEVCASCDRWIVPS